MSIPIGQLAIDQGAVGRQSESSRCEINFCQPQTTDFVQCVEVEDSAASICTQLNYRFALDRRKTDFLVRDIHNPYWLHCACHGSTAPLTVSAAPTLYEKQDSGSFLHQQMVLRQTAHHSKQTNGHRRGVQGSTGTARPAW